MGPAAPGDGIVDRLGEATAWAEDDEDTKGWCREEDGLRLAPRRAGRGVGSLTRRRKRVIEKKAEVIEGHDAAIAPMRAAAMDDPAMRQATIASLELEPYAGGE